MKFEYAHLDPSAGYSRAVLAHDENTKVEVYNFLSPETLAAIERDARVAAANALNLQPQV